MPEQKATRRGVCTICTGPCTDEGRGFYRDLKPLGTVRGIPPHFNQSMVTAAWRAPSIEALATITRPDTVAKIAPATIVFGPGDFAEAVAQASQHVGLVGEIA